MLLSLDCETTGVDLRHAARPFFVTTCDESGQQQWWEWDVDPLTRMPTIPEEDIEQIRNLVVGERNSATGSKNVLPKVANKPNQPRITHGKPVYGDPSQHPRLVLQNPKFDIAALEMIGLWEGVDVDDLWSRIDDTLLAGHLLASNQPHDLTSMALQYLGVDIEPFEVAVGAACNEARRIARSKFPEWMIAKPGVEGMPSARDKCWKFDMWLPRAIVQHWWNESEAKVLWDDLSKTMQPTKDEPSPRRKNAKTVQRLALSMDEILNALTDLQLAHGWEYHPPETDAGIASWEMSGFLKVQQEKTKLNPDTPWQIVHDALEELGKTPDARKLKALALGKPTAIEVLAHPWWTVLRDYANADSSVTLALWRHMQQEIARRELEAIYEERRKVLRVAYRMEKRGVSLSGERLQALKQEYTEQSQQAANVCTNIARDMGYELTLPKSGKNKSLMEFCFGADQAEPGTEVIETPLFAEPKRWLNLPIVSTTDTGLPSLDKAAMKAYEDILPRRSKALVFIRALAAKRQRDTAIAYMQGYERFWSPLRHQTDESDTIGESAVPGWFVLYPHLNPTGTHTLRWSSSTPNEQNISKQEGFNLRFAFGPAPGREWWSLDAKNIELRIPAYEAREEAFIALFERPDDPPYFGSNHLLISHILHKEKFEECVDSEGRLDGRIFKKRYTSSLYHRVKCGNFALQYGAVDKDDGSGTADRAYGIPGAQKIIASRFAKQEALNQHWIRFAAKNGYVETMPDKTVDPKKGYPIMCTRTEYGKIKPTVPLNFHVQGTAMWWMLRAMNRCQEKLDYWQQSTGFDGYMVMQVHDELVFDFPKSRVHPKECINERGDEKSLFRTSKSNLWRIRIIQKLMEQGGDDIGVPTPTSCEYHEVSWDEGVSL